MAPLLLIAGLGIALAAHLAPGLSHTGGALAGCPMAGTNWDAVTGICH
jgi:multisubunit Na+/H+ antiporter MnhB subunit